MSSVADALVGEFVTSLVHVVEENASLIIGIKDQIDDLLDDLRSFNAYLRQASRNQTAADNDVLKDIVGKIKNVVTQAEDAISNFTVERKKHKEKWVLMRYFEKVAYIAKVNSSVREIQSIRDKVKKIRTVHASALQALIDDPNRAQPAQQRMAPVVEEDNVVGFDEEAKTIKDRLRGGSVDLTVIAIEGMAGLGKTTLTKMVFKDRDLQYEFFTYLWVYVSRTFSRRQIFLDILSNFTKNTKEFHDMSDDNLAAKIKGFLEGGKYFVVVDDVWEKQHWDWLRIAFPDNKKGSRVLLTTRHHDVALHANTASNPHNLKFLTNEESWQLLEKKVFRREKCPPVLESTGKRIAIKCNGLPLAIVVIAGVLDKDSTPTEWKEVAEDPFPKINKENQSYNELVKLSYNNLPYHLKNCFLYLGAFPIGQEIAASKLIRLWISEGFVPLSEGGYSSDLERTAERFLKDLVNRNLLMVLKRKADGQIKTCRIHDTLHEFCKAEAARGNLFYEIDGSKQQFESPRRLCVHSSILDFLKSEMKPSSDHVRSFLSFCLKEIEVPREHVTAIPKSFPLLRVMDVESLKFSPFPKELYELYHLRYLAISTSDLKFLPKPLEKLWNMQTLVLNTPRKSLEVKADIWSMTRLRHVQSNTSLQLPSPSPKTSSGGSTDIQTLSPISPSSCTKAIFEKTPILQKLGIRGNLAELVEIKGGTGMSLIDNLEKLDCLESLKLINDTLQESKPVWSSPRVEKFPRSLRKLTLSGTSFYWKHFHLLGSLEELEVLKLEENAFRGELCSLNNAVFKQLQYLRIGRTDLVSWTVSEHNFPVLKYLILRNCSALDFVPPAFGSVESLKVIELFCTNKRAADSAREIRKEGVSLSIYPPDH